jgi:hypothetical protein
MLHNQRCRVTQEHKFPNKTHLNIKTIIMSIHELKTPST